MYFLDIPLHKSLKLQVIRINEALDVWSLYTHTHIYVYIRTGYVQRPSTQWGRGSEAGLARNLGLQRPLHMHTRTSDLGTSRNRPQEE